MKTIFLAAGRSSRMAPISDKNFLDFCGEPLILRLLKNAHKGGLQNFVIVGNTENKNKIEALCAEHDFLSNAQVVVQPGNEGMAEGITEGLTCVEDDEPLTILGGNDYVNPDIYGQILEQSQGLDGGILAKKMTEYFPGGYLSLNNDGTIQSIVEKPGEGNEPSDVVNIVVHHFSRAGDLKQALSDSQSYHDDLYEVALDKLFKSGKYKAVEYDDYWQAVKYPWHVLQLADLCLSQQETAISKQANIADSAILRGDNIVIEDRATIYDNAAIIGPCYIGKNAVVGNNALVRNSIISENSSAGYNTEIARSYLAPNVTTHIAYIGDSVIDSGVNFGAYSCTANLRLDKADVKVNVKDQRIDSKMPKLGAIVGPDAQVGIHAALMPGCKVEAGELVPPHSLKK